MMRYKGYIGKIEFDPDARILHGEVLGIRDIVTFQGSSVQEIEKAFHESVDDYLSFCKERGEQPDKPFSGRFVLRVTADLHRSLDMVAHASGKSLNAFIAERLREDIAKLRPHSSGAKARRISRNAERKSGTIGGKPVSNGKTFRRAATGGM
jgi:predicted HicB family RNase H-like nuclease